MKKDYQFKIDPKDLPPLTEEQKAYPYADLYYRDIAEPCQKIKDAFAPDSQIDPSNAILPEDLNKFLDPDFVPEMGYCILPSGAGYSCGVVDLPDAKLEMFDYRLKLVFSEDMGFIVEYPGFHFEHYNGVCVEDSYDGPKALILDRNYSAFDLGFSDLPTKLNPAIVGFSAHEQDFVSAEGPINPTQGRGALILITKKLEKGLQHIWLVYYGLHVRYGKSDLVLGENEVIDPEQCRRAGLHLTYESVNQVQFLSEMMKRYPDREFSPERPWPERLLFLKH